MADANISKKAAGEKAAEYVKDGMVLGLGTGSTVKYFIERLAARIKEEQIEVVGIPTSIATEKTARVLGIPLTAIGQYEKIDLDVDGADEVDPKYNLIKGGGGAHTREKIVASASKTFIVIADSGKMVSRLGAFPVAIEVIPYAEDYVRKELQALGGLAKKREGFVSDNGNLILDARFNIVDPAGLEKDLNNIPGVLENGIFARRRPEKVIVGEGTKTKILERV
jgi:ribose 5-phosphate isomerase A